MVGVRASSITRTLIICKVSIMSALVKLDLPPMTVVLLKLDLKLIDGHLFLQGTFPVQGNVLQTKDPFKHLLLVLEHDLFDPVVRQGM
jgi:hypothetical protein